MADEIVIRIEDGDEDGEELNRSSADASAAQVTMESLFGATPWWLEPEWLNSASVGDQPRIEYPTSPSGNGEGTETECECAEYFEQIIEILLMQAEILTHIQDNTEDFNIQVRENQQTDNRQLINVSNQINAAIQNGFAAINAAQFLNNPIDAATNVLSMVGNFASNITSTVVSTAISTLLAPVLGPFAQVVGTAIGAAAGGAVRVFFETITQGIQGVFDYVENRVKDIAPFSPEFMGEAIDRELRKLEFDIAAGSRYGSSFADTYAAQTDLIMELENIKLELFRTFGPVVTGAAKDLTDILAWIRTGIGAFTREELLNSIYHLVGMLSAISPVANAAFLAWGPAAQARLLKYLEDAERRDLERQNQAGMGIQEDFARQFGWIQ